jgi:beta-barrel assembly-enhancing protease
MYKSIHYVTGIILIVFFATMLTTSAWAVESPPPAKPVKQTEEDKLGEKTAVEFEKQMKIVPNSPEIPRLERIANEIAPWTERPKIHYTVKVLESKGVNAVSIPGGRLYVTEGALKAVESDDELAAVLAHEIAHNSLKHAMAAQKKATRGNLGVMAAIIAGIASGKSEIPLIASQITEGTLNHYGREAELQADKHGLMYLTHTKYQPVAMLTVLEGLAQMEVSQGRSADDSTSTHPLAKARVEAAKTQLEKMGVNIAAARRLVTSRYKIESKTVEQDGRTVAQLLLNEKVVFAPAQSDGELQPLQRAQAYGTALQNALQHGLQMVDLKTVQQGEDAVVMGMDTVLIKVTAADAATYKRNALSLAQDAQKVISVALYAEKLSRPF